MKHSKSRFGWSIALALAALFACSSQSVPPPAAPSAPAEPAEQAEKAPAAVVAPEKPGQYPKTASIKSEIKYLIHLPTGYPERAARYPLIVFLHGSGERGSDLEIVKKHGIAKVAERYQEFPFITVSPQAAEGTRWTPATLNQLLDQILAQYPVDPDRVYLTGLSMGGFGTWAWAQQNPERFAAIAPICGGGDVTKADKLRAMPVWAFHGALDERVPLRESQVMVDALSKLGGEAQLTVYPDLHHDSWTRAYENTDLYLWFLKHARRGATAFKLSAEDRAFFEAWAIRSSVGELETVEPFQLGKAAGKFRALIKNPSQSPIRVVERWTLPEGSRWTIEPKVAERTLAPGASESLEFAVTYAGDRYGLLPLPVRETAVFRDATKIGESSKPLAFSGDAFFADKAPRARAARARVAPALDGRLDDAAWRGASVISGFRNGEDGTLNPAQGKMLVTYDEQYLYVGGESSLVGGALTRAIDKRDGNLWEDDSVEILVDPKLDHETYFHFVVNANGSLYDARAYEQSWNGASQAKASVTEAGWSFEIRIPWSDLGVKPPAGTKIGLQLARNFPAGKLKDQWALAYGSVHQPKRFGVLDLAR